LTQDYGQELKELLSQ